MKACIVGILAVVAVMSVAQLNAAEGAAPKADPAGTAPLALSPPVSVKSFTPSSVVLPAKNIHPGQKLTYTLVSGPSHGVAILPPNRIESSSPPATATYTSARDYVGPDSFTWKMSDGSADSNVATVSIMVQATVPIPDSQVACVVKDTAVDISASYSGGGGYSYSIKSGNPEHGTLTINGTTFHYVPAPGYTGSDSFTWSMTCTLKDPKSAPAQTKTVTCFVAIKPPGLSDWPQWRGDEWRSGFTTMNLPAALHLQWRRDLPPSPSPFSARNVYPDIDYCRPVQLGKTLFVPVTASDNVSAFNTDTGELKWRFYASGAVRRPPAALELADKSNVVIFGSDDGWVYCLNAADGSVRWKFHAAPNNRKAVGFGRISSVWPVWASPVVSGGRVYLTAGYIPAFGLYAYCLDAATGAIVWVNDGRISDMWNTSAFGPLALSYDGKRIYGSVEGAARPWVLNSANGEFMGHTEVGFKFAGSGHQLGDDTKRDGSRGWYTDGGGAQNVPEPMAITVGSQTFTPAGAAALGVSGTVASLLAGDGKLFVTTAEGSVYCFSGAQVKPTIHSAAPTQLPDTSDGFTAAAKTMLSRDDLKVGFAFVFGLGSGRLVEELAKQSSLRIVAVDSDHGKLQALRAKMDAAGLSGTRVSTIEGNPLDFAFSPCIAALITSEDLKGLVEKPGTIERLYNCTRPFGGEIWLPTSESQHAAIAGFVSASKNMPLSEIKRAGAYTQLLRTGLPDEKLRIKPPFGLVTFGCEDVNNLQPSSPPQWHWTDRDVYSWLPMKAKMTGYVPPEPKYSDQKGYPTPTTVSTPRSIFTTMTNPLYATNEKFTGLPSSGNDGACSAYYTRYGDFGLTPGKTASFFDASADYWGRMIFTEAGGCPGNIIMRNGVIVIMSNSVPGICCGCSPAMQFSCFSLAPMENEETWINYQTVRTSNSVEDAPVTRIGINFGAPGDRFEDGLLWTHHPYAGRYGRFSYNFESMPEALPLVPVSYRGPVQSVYHHSAQMEKSSLRDRSWVAASQVKGMTGLTVHLAQPVVALRTAVAPKVDGDLSDECWKGQKRLIFNANKTYIDRDKEMGATKADDHCYAMLRYDDVNLYVAAGVHTAFGSPIPWRTNGVKYLTVTLNSRERIAEDVILTGTDNTEKGKQSTGIAPAAWTYAASTAGPDAFTAEMAIPWEKLAAAGLWKEQLLININIAASSLTAQYTPLYLDAPRGAAAKRPHTVRLYFAEMEGKTAGQRVFDVNLQGEAVLKSLDVVKEAGGPKRELMKEFKGVGITEGLDIEFKATAGEPMLSGVEIIAESTASAKNAAPVATIEASTLAGPAPLSVTFSAQKSQDSNGQIVECAWDTGDGRLAKGSVLQHVFAEPGEYHVHLLVRDNHGSLAASSVVVKVASGDPAAFVCAIRAKDGDFSILSAWEAAIRSDLTGAAGKSLLFTAKGRGSYAAGDDGKALNFTGGGTGTLRHINGSNIAYVTGCQGAIQAGPATCASGHTFEVVDAGHPIFLSVAECYNDWPAGLSDNINASGWTTSATRCAVIRPAKGQGHDGRMKGANGSFSGFALKGNFDATAMPHIRIERLIFDPASTLTAGPAASLNRVLAGAIKLSECAMAANSVGTTLSAGNTKNIINQAVSSYTVNLKIANDQFKVPKLIGSRTGFYNCTATTFDPGNQVEVEFINCLAAPGGKGFLDNRYSEPGYANHCVSTDNTATIWNSGDGSECNAASQKVEFINASAGDYHLAANDQGAKGRGALGLGADISGEERTGPTSDVGAHNATARGPSR